MAFGKRRAASSEPPQGPSEAPAPPPPGLPGAHLIAPNLMEFDADPVGGSDRILDFLLETYNDAYGVHGVSAETVLSAAGALAGFAAQEAIWEGLVRPGHIDGAQAFVRVKTRSGETYLFGDLLNAPLTGTPKDRLTVWSLVAAPAMRLGAPSLPPLAPIFENCAQTVGTPAFGLPVLPSHLNLKEMPREALRHWPRVKSILLSAGVDPLLWPLAIGAAAQKIIFQTKDVLPADIGALVVMQAAIPMSKVDPRTVPGGTHVGDVEAGHAAAIQMNR